MGFRLRAREFHAERSRPLSCSPPPAERRQRGDRVHRREQHQRPSSCSTTSRSVISGRAQLSDPATGNPNGSAEVVIISNQPGLQPPPAPPRLLPQSARVYLALILFLPPTDHLGTFEPGRPRETKDRQRAHRGETAWSGGAVPGIEPRIHRPARLSEQPGGEAVGSFNLLYSAPQPLVGSFRSTGSSNRPPARRSTALSCLDSAPSVVCCLRL